MPFVGWLWVSPKALVRTHFGNWKSKGLHGCTREMSPSALQRVCPSRQETQVAPSFPGTGVPREAGHVPGVRCLDSLRFMLSLADVATERKARRCEKRGPISRLFAGAFAKLPARPGCIPEVGCSPPHGHALRLPAPFPSPVEQVVGDESPRSWTGDRAADIVTCQAGLTGPVSHRFSRIPWGSPGGGNPLM